MAQSADELKLSGVAVSFTLIAAMLLIVTGLITAFSGAWELLFGGVHRDTETVVELSARTWGAIHFGLGILMVAGGFNLFVGKFWARMVGLAVATFMLIAAILAMPDSPVFSAFLIVFNAIVIWALLFHGRDLESIAA
jgi:hypothetical protein